MGEEGRRRFLTVGDFHVYKGEIQELAKQGENVAPLLNEVRQACYKDIELIRERPLLVYFVRFPGQPDGAQISLSLEDIDGFVDLVGSVEADHTRVDVLVHSPGGDPTATERIVTLLRSRFDEVCFLVPHSAYSAATMLALSGDEIIMHQAATLGPIDPQINGIPAGSILRGFKNVRDLLKREGPDAIPAFVPLLDKHTLEGLEICADAEALSKELATEWLTSYMFRGESGEDLVKKVEALVDYLANYEEHKFHSRPLKTTKLSDLGLKVNIANGELAVLLREAQILLSGFMGMTAFIKLFENTSGISWGHHFKVQSMPGKPEGAA